MIPSLVARELRTSIVEYLATTFALSDDEVYAALSEFLLDPRDGIFRGPYLRVRLPFVEAGDDSELGVTWSPPGFRPYAHQALAWQRLSGRGLTPKPTLITAGTGSGKSEGFLVPVVDHCIWARTRGQAGIKALILYPMNALVTDQERRVAQMLQDPVVRAAGVRGGVWIGDDSTVAPRREMTADHLISDPNALRDYPPDILLTNYKMLDRLLTNESRQRLWAANSRPGEDAGWEQPLRYLVLDEFHTYDGAQGTDVAMLLRRLGQRLGTATAVSPLTGVGCVGTSATLGSAPTAAADMCGFASKVFGVRFDANAVVGEQRKSVAEVCSDIDFSLPVPTPRDVAALDPLDLDELAGAFTGSYFDEAHLVGERLLRHRLTASLLRAAADRPRTWSAAVAALCAQVPEWDAVRQRDSDVVDVALERFVALVSHARSRTASGMDRPLFAVEVQMWIREVTRLRRTVSVTPAFRWADSPPPFEDEAALELPAVYCTTCGRSGWMAVANRAAGQGQAAIERLLYDEADPYSVSVRDRERTRTMIRAVPEEPDVLWLDPESGQVHHANGGGFIPVLAGGMTGTDARTGESRDEAARRQQCPSCGTRDAIRFLGSRVTTLASVGITQMFGSDYVAEEERKLLAFTDSVQDASHRAAFFSGRTHRFNLRATLSGALQSKGRVPLTEVADVVLTRADNGDHPADDLFSLVPPDLLWEGSLTAAWERPSTHDADGARRALASRLTFDAVLEAGLRARLGRTLETTSTAIAEVLVSNDEWSRINAFVVEAIQAHAGQLLAADDARVQTWAQGLVERLRLRGGIFHPFLDPYVADHGRRWLIWGGAAPFAPKFPQGISAPAFFASPSSDEFDPIGGAQSWVALWTKKTIGIEGGPADAVARDLLHVLVETGVFQARNSKKGTVWGIPIERLEFIDIASDGDGRSSTELRCNLCSSRQYTSPTHFPRWLGTPCLRARCTGVYEPTVQLPTNYYRQLYRSGRIRRVVAAEHTGMLNRARRERVEAGFKSGGRPDAPNVLAATPTLEMGIDIGDLSAVMLTAVPPTQTNYIQRVGRAGRKTGNAFVTTFAEADSRSLYYLHDPELMIAGEIPAPNCHLDAIEILRRQYLAFLVDQAAVHANGLVPAAGDMPHTIGQVATSGMASDGWLRTIIEAGTAPDLVTRFVSLFGTHLDPTVAARLASWAATDMVGHVEVVLQRWQRRLQTLINQRDRLRDREKALKELLGPSDEDLEALGRIDAELRYIAGRITRTRNQDTLGALEALGLLPNYTLFDDTVTLEVSLWRLNDQHNPADEASRRFVSESQEYARAATVAIRELAPGNWFYVDAHRVRIDAVDVGTEHEPAHSTWRFCPECAWATSDASASIATCPRCGSPGVSDQGSIVSVLPMRVVSSTERETTARVGDDTEDRDREWFEVLTTVDVATEDISAAYVHSKTVFGIEAARSARIRYLNLGLDRAAQARPLRVGGYDSSASMFRVCRHCGSVFGIRGDFRDPADPNHHRTWCKVRSGARREQWDDLLLVHELETEAVRILLPVAEFEAPERITSFKAALWLGLRDSFGGAPDHLRVVESQFPVPDDPSVRSRLLVVHDTVPGGTGYLPRLADPERLRTILSRAVELIASCDCQTRGQPGCHKCLFTGVSRTEIPLVSRQLALEMLDEILTDWHLRPAESGTITGVNLTPVRQSELERMFKSLLQRWPSTASVPVTLSSSPDPDKATLTRFALRFQDGPHWEIREQVNLAHHGTVPDFYATRVDAPGTAPIAIYLDGWDYHGNDADQVDEDATRRASLRSAGVRVWNLTWRDVRAALTAANEGRTVAPALPIPAAARTRAITGAKQANGGDHAVFKAISDGAFDQLALYMLHPDPSAWRHLAIASALAPATTGVTFPVTDRVATINAAGHDDPVDPADHSTDVAYVEWLSQDGGQRVAAVLDRTSGPEPTVVVSYDTTSQPDRPRWSDWLQLGNLFQYLDERVVITTTRSFVPDTSGPVTAAVPSAPAPIDTRLDDIFDDTARDLARHALEHGYGQFVVGMSAEDADDTPLEVAWPTQRIAVLAVGTERPATLADWDIRPADQWSHGALIEALRGVL